MVEDMGGEMAKTLTLGMAGAVGAFFMWKLLGEAQRQLEMMCCPSPEMPRAIKNIDPDC